MISFTSQVTNLYILFYLMKHFQLTETSNFGQSLTSHWWNFLDHYKTENTLINSLKKKVTENKHQALERIRKNMASKAHEL